MQDRDGVKLQLGLTWKLQEVKAGLGDWNYEQDKGEPSQIPYNPIILSLCNPVYSPITT